MSDGTCRVIVCQTGRRRQGLCHRHYRAEMRGESIGEALPRVELSRSGGPCDVPECRSLSHIKGLCKFHYGRHKAGAQLDAPRRVKWHAEDSLERDANGRKRCSDCRTWLELNAFSGDVRSVDALDKRCRDCVANYRSLRYFGITRDAVKLLVAEQGGCKICHTFDPGVKGWHVDHDHACCPRRKATCGKCVRGILCGPCNVALGFFEDDPARLRSAFTYLEGWNGESRDK